ncbi:hypothetical protein SAMN05444487_102232 [Marininema mesophilum]|uniref:Uncharacterized protein n=1 Tax=Marininema mesophilum TaxID=1048340 RepID=A0A1H2SKT1_9BACL|nr:hypothetical protein [Marininema mesophilum]SDW31669.1 hypothetical protein SAMN05444487_102232 [Marininema mesophilum]
MIFKKISAMIAVGAVAASLLMPSASFADGFNAQGWDYVGKSTFTTQSSTVQSSGGNFQFCFSQTSTIVPGTYWLWEDDGDDHQLAGEVTISAGTHPCAVFYGIGGYVDGSNNKAEFLLMKNNSKTATVKFYD